MNLYYDKNNSWKINSPSTVNLCSHIFLLEKTKKYLTIKQCARLSYIMNQSVSIWTDDDYMEFLKKSSNDLSESYMTVMKSSKGQHNIINRENIDMLKNDFELIMKLLSHIIACMILDNKKKLYIDE